jgi:Mg-chelatase subunit ChlD
VVLKKPKADNSNQEGFSKSHGEALFSFQITTRRYRVEYENIASDLKSIATGLDQGQPGLEKPKLLTPSQMAALASGLGRKHGIKVHFGNYETAATDGKSIVLPLTSKENSWIARGYLSHETAHIRLTDLGHISKVTPFHKTIWNVLEDIRVEKVMSQLYPGMETNYRTLVRELLATNRNFFELPQNSPPNAVFAAYIGLILRSLYLRQPELCELALATRDQFLNTFGPTLERNLFMLLTEIGEAESTADICSLVDKIIELLQQHRDNPPDSDVKTGQDTQAKQDESDQFNKAQKNQDKPDIQADPNNVKQSPNNPDTLDQFQSPETLLDSQAQPDLDPPQEQDQGNTNPAKNQQGENNADLPIPDNSDQTAFDSDSAQQESGEPAQTDPSAQEKVVSADASSVGIAQQRPEPSPIQQAITEALDATEELSDFGEQLKNLAQEQENAAGNDPSMFRVGISVSPNDLKMRGYSLVQVSAATRVVSELSGKLQGLLQATALQHARPSCAGNRINRSRLHRIKTGEHRLFLRKDNVRAVNTAFHVLVDNSSSMRRRERNLITKHVCMALVKTLSNVRNVNLGLTVFPAFYPYPENPDGSVDMPIASVVKHGIKLGGNVLWPHSTTGDTPLAEALRHVCVSMLPLTETRKIVCVLSDGDPNDLDSAKAAFEEAKSLGIQVVTLGIEEVLHTELFKNFVVVQKVEELPQKTFDLLEKLLTNQGGNKHA